MKTLGVAGGTALGAVFGLWWLDVFTWGGLAAAFVPWADTSQLTWAWGPRIVWWTLALELAALRTMNHVYREARLECATYFDLWLSAHVSLVQRGARRAKWAAKGVKVAVKQHQRHRPVHVPSTIPTPVSTPSTVGESNAA